MKPSYKLLGAIWNHRPTLNHLPKRVAYDQLIHEVGSNPNLFDFCTKRRKVFLSSLLSLETADQLDDLLSQLRCCDQIFIEMDWEPINSGKIVWDFFLHRLSQICRCIANFVPSALLFLMDSPIHRTAKWGDHLASLFSLLLLADDYAKYLKGKGVSLSDSGNPVIPSNCFLRDVPELLVSFRHRNEPFVINKSRTVICFFCSDRENYPRLSKILVNLPIYRQFLGVVATDVTVTRDMDLEWQKTVHASKPTIHCGSRGERN